jgi:hypothetical protein
LDYHPHLHVIVPGGRVDQARHQWKKKKGKYLFNEFALAEVFRARFLTAIKTAGLSIPAHLPAQWVTDCKHAGTVWRLYNVLNHKIIASFPLRFLPALTFAITGV